ncbi:MAG: hypothetical protein G01um101430_399 [Parcubacteria group bacterium Gr01-1014_30]|nr:MAG: hypothetical protein G01um101430_399 [Parcubacteria group bacterium Gr01-1014_30]
MDESEKRKTKSVKHKFPSELRFDLISKDWVVIATGRARRPETFKKEKRVKEEIPKKECPFCNIGKDEKPTLVLSNTIVLPNKYPAFTPHAELHKRVEGKFYQTVNAVGFHEVVVTRDHKKSLAQLSTAQVKEVMDAYHQRYLELKKEKFVHYVSIFHNHGKEAGASISHPHSQIITTPLVDTDLRKALANSGKYFIKTGKCIYCEMNIWERRVKKRVVFENEEFQVICPFASKAAFEMIISPKKHMAYFEDITENEKWQLADTFRQALHKLYKALADPSYNFYLHTAPCDARTCSYYHWHWTIVPKTATWAGFEIGTRIEISTIEPERAAEYLRKQ